MSAQNKKPQEKETTSAPRMGSGPRMLIPAEKPKHFKKTMKELTLYLRPYWAKILMVGILAVASTVFIVFGPLMLGEITNTIKDAIDEGVSINFDYINQIAILLGVLYFGSALFNYIQGFIMVGITQQVSYDLRQSLSKKIHRLPLSYFDTRPFGDVLSRVTNDVDTVGQTLNQGLTELLRSLTSIIGILAVMVFISWQLTLIALITVPLSGIAMRYIIKFSQRFFRAQQKTLGELNGHVEETYSGHTVIKVFNGEKNAIDAFKRINERLYGSAWKSQFVSGIMWPLMIFIGNLGYVGVAVFGSVLFLQSMLSLGGIQAFMQYMRQFNQPIQSIANTANMLQSTAAAAERVFQFLAEPEEEVEMNKLPTPLDVKGEVTFKHVKFGYNKEEMVIKDFSAEVKAGQKIAIVGPTGAGKTTLVNLLMRFYEVNEGQILIDGVDIKAYPREVVRSLFAMVLQDAWLFEGSIKDNIGYGKIHASDEEIQEAAKSAQVDHFIHSIAGGYDLALTDSGTNLSQGQRQLLTIARAMLANSPMLILDEATSSVDTRTEILIQQAMRRLMEGRTSFIIAHRLSTIKDADNIFVMNQGNIVEQGTHEQLIAQNGFYAELYNSQFDPETA